MYASVLYELRETDFFKISQMDVGDTTNTKMIKKCREPTIDERRERDPNEIILWETATIAFTMIKTKTGNTPILTRFDPDTILVSVVYASNWAVSASILQEYDGVY